MGPGAANIAEIVPEIRGKLPDLGTPRALEPGSARFRLFDSITTFLKNAAQSQPLMLVLDDLHWADRSSLLLLEFLAQEIGNSPLLLVGAHRDVEVSRGHPLSQTLGALVREQLFHRVQLDGLTLVEVGELVEGSAGITLTVEASEAVHSRTDGNPFFVGEITRGVTLESITQDVNWASKIPEGVRDAISRRLNRLSEQCNRMLTTASIIGREFDFRLLDILIEDMSEDQLLQAVDEALSAHLLENARGQRDRYQFAHALIQETLSEELSTSRRVRLHARTAEALEALYGDDAEAHSEELAHHFDEAQTSTGITKLVRYSLLAGERALASYAYENAVTHFGRGMVARDINLSGTEGASDEEAAALLFGLARAQSTAAEAHQFPEVFATLSRAFEYYAQAGQVALAVAVAEFQIAVPGNRILGVAELIAHALTLVPADSYEAGRLLSRYGGILGDEKADYEGAQQVMERAIAIARREGDVVLEFQTLSHAAGMGYFHLHLRESIDNGLRAIELDTGEENPFAYMPVHWFTAISLLAIGDLDAARPHALVERDHAKRRGTPRVSASHFFTPITYLACLEGDWKAGREYSDKGMEVSPLNPLLLGPRVLLEYETGESAQGEVYLERRLEAMRRAGPGNLQPPARVSMVMPAVARITGVAGRLEIAEAAAEGVLSEQYATPIYVLQVKACLALLAVQKGDRSSAEEHYAYMQGQRSTMIATVMSVDRLLGLLSQTMSNPEQAAVHFEDALAFCRKAGYRPDLAWSCCDYADLLLQRASAEEGRGGSRTAPTDHDRAKPMSLLEESLAISSELGMRPLVERVTERLERARAEPVRAPAYPDGLTQREVEVLRLIAEGKTNLEIAEELVIAEGTARRHVANIYEKIGAANRVEAASYASRHGLSR